jgi:ribosomal protein S18 acetylase RimI-like enzyme
MKIRGFRESDRVAVIDLWRRNDLTRPWNDADLDVDRKVAHDPDGFLVGEVDGRLVATAMFGYDGHRGSVGYLGVDPDAQGSGLGRILMDEIERRLVEMGCPKVNLLVRSSNGGVTEFYRRLGYDPDETVSMGKRLIADPGPE